MGLIFTDERINSGIQTLGYVDVTLLRQDSGYTLILNRLVFDDSSATTIESIRALDEFNDLRENSRVAPEDEYPEFTPTNIPEPSSLGLLALGAGGVLMRRNRVA